MLSCQVSRCHGQRTIPKVTIKALFTYFVYLFVRATITRDQHTTGLFKLTGLDARDQDVGRAISSEASLQIL